jgi:hypothetical protein
VEDRAEPATRAVDDSGMFDTFAQRERAALVAFGWSLTGPLPVAEELAIPGWRSRAFLMWPAGDPSDVVLVFRDASGCGDRPQPVTRDWRPDTRRHLTCPPVSTGRGTDGQALKPRGARRSRLGLAALMVGAGIAPRCAHGLRAHRAALGGRRPACRGGERGGRDRVRGAVVEPGHGKARSLPHRRPAGRRVPRQRADGARCRHHAPGRAGHAGRPFPSDRTSPAAAPASARRVGHPGGPTPLERCKNPWSVAFRQGMIRTYVGVCGSGGRRDEGERQCGAQLRH